jgi:hypothetical protein
MWCPAYSRGDPAAANLQPLDDRKKNRTLVFKEYLDHLREGTDVV